MNVRDWPTWEDGKPVQVGEVAMSACGPLRIDGIEVMDGAWRLWSNQSMYEGADKWLYIIDEGEFGKYEGHPARNGEDCEFWEDGDQLMPEFVFAPMSLTDMDGEVSRSYTNALIRLIGDLWHELNYTSIRAEDGTNDCLKRMDGFEKRMTDLRLLGE